MNLLGGFMELDDMCDGIYDQLTEEEVKKIVNFVRTTKLKKGEMVYLDMQNDDIGTSSISIGD
jgi:hypothetical protein